MSSLSYLAYLAKAIIAHKVADKYNIKHMDKQHKNRRNGHQTLFPRSYFFITLLLRGVMLPAYIICFSFPVSVAVCGKCVLPKLRVWLRKRHHYLMETLLRQFYIKQANWSTYTERNPGNNGWQMYHWATSANSLETGGIVLRWLNQKNVFHGNKVSWVQISEF